VTTQGRSILGAALEWFQDGKPCTAEQMTHHILNSIVDGAGGLTPGGIPASRITVIHSRIRSRLCCSTVQIAQITGSVIEII
jgi:hypothetical protein